MQADFQLHSLSGLRVAWDRVAAGNPGLRSREVASALNCSEADLIATGRGARMARLLDAGRIAEWLPLIAAQPNWMWLVRNEWAVLEKDVNDFGHDGNLGFSAPDGAVSIDSVRASNFICLLTEPEQRMAASVQIFNPRGEAVLKLFLKSRRDKGANLASLAPYARDIGDGLLAKPNATVAEPRIGSVPGIEQSLPRSLHKQLIETAVEHGASIELEVANSGARMWARLSPKRLKPMENWFNIMERGFNLHLQEPGLSESRFSIHEGALTARILAEDGIEALRIILPDPIAEGLLDEPQC